MKPRFLMKTAALLALAVSSTLALADDPPAQVGRIALTQGQVSISAGQGDAASTALVNWPVTSSNTVTTAPGARTELRVGSSAIRLDGDSSLDVIQLDDDNLRLRLHYGSVNIRIVNPEVLGGFELSTPQGRVLLQEAGRLRVDAELAADTSSINVFDGVAIVEGGGERLTVRAGRRADITGPDLRTAQAVRDAFDDWALERDRQADSALATRYIPREMTGYEDLDRYGSWSSDSEYGTLWIPSVSSTWVPYRDGRWTWIAPWGWTWVDNAPWGYAPFHYGRWVQVNRRWAWAPGHHERRPVWAPALVGWVGGAGWNLNFNSRPSAGQGWYPLAPHERFVPGYRLSDDHLRRLAWQAARGRDGKHDGKKRDYRREGLTVVPQDRFNGRREVVVPREPRATPPANWARAPVALPPTPPVKFGSIGQGANVRDAARAVAEDAARTAGRNDGRGELRGEARGNERRDWNRDGRPDGRADGRPDGRLDYAGRGSQPVAVPSSPAVPAAPAASSLPAPPQAAVIGSSVPVISGGGRERDRDDRVYQDLRARSEDGRRNRYQQRAGSEAQAPRSAVPVLSGQPAPVMSAQPAPERNWSRDVQRDAQRDAQRAAQREAQREAPREAHRESPRFGSAGAMEAAAAAAAARAQQQARSVPTAISAPPPRAMPSPPPAPAPAIAAPAPSPAPAAAPERRHAPAAQPRNADDGGGRRGPARQMER